MTEEEEISKEARAHALELVKRFGVLPGAAIESDEPASDELVSSGSGPKTKVPKGSVQGVGRRTRIKK